MNSPETELPEGWALVRIAEAFELNPRKPAPDALPEDAPVTFVPMSAVDAERGAITALEQHPFSQVRKGYTAFQDGDVIMAKITPCMENGKAAIARELTNGLGFGSTEFHVFRPTGVALPEYLYHFIRQESFRRAAEAEMTGSVGQKRVPAEYVRDAELPLPPLAEQRRIVAKLEEVLAQVSAARERLERMPAILKRFRQAVLAAACSGRLTEGWRAEHPNVEPVSVTLQRAGRTQLIPRRRRGEGAETEIHELPELPNRWEWVRFGSLGKDPSDAIQTGPFGAQLHNSEFTESGVPVIAVGNLTGMGFTCEGLYYITESKAEQLSRYDVQAGDVLFARSGATLGKVCVAPDFVQNWRMTGHILRARLTTDLVLPTYSVYALRGDPAVVEQIFGSIRGVTRPGFNTSLLESVRIPLPPLPEQQKIVRGVEALFAWAEAVERRVAAARGRVERLTQAVLAKAFRGELVPTEAEVARGEGREYEPAAVMVGGEAEQAASKRVRRRKRSGAGAQVELL